MDINEEILKYINSAINKIAEHGQRIQSLIEEDEEDTKEFEQLMDKIELMDWTISALYDANYNIVDSNNNDVYNFIDKTNNEIMSIISDWRYLFELDVYPASDAALQQYLITKEEEASTGLTVPAYPANSGDYVLRIDNTGNAFWVLADVSFEVINY